MSIWNKIFALGFAVMTIIDVFKGGGKALSYLTLSLLFYILSNQEDNKKKEDE